MNRTISIHYSQHRSNHLARLVFVILLTLVVGTQIVPQSSVQGQVSGGLVVQIRQDGTDNNKESHFGILVKNTGSTPLSNVSVRVNFTPDGTNAAADYVLENYYASTPTTVSGPTANVGGQYYFTISFGSATLQPHGMWEFKTALHLKNWATTLNTANDFFHTGYATGALPGAYTDDKYLPGYVNGTQVWGEGSSSGLCASSGPASGLTVQIRQDGTDTNKESHFAILVKNTSGGSLSGISIRVFFALDGANAASNYMLEKYYDQSGAASISGPTSFSGNVNYFTVNFGGASLADKAQWEFKTNLHLRNWDTSFNSTDDPFHNGYAVGALPAAYTDQQSIPGYIGSTLAWGKEPSFAPGGSSGGTGGTPTHVDNPYDGATGFINCDFYNQVKKQAQNTADPVLAAKMMKVAQNSVAVWLSSTASANDVPRYLDAALAQQSGSTPVVITFVIYDMPQRDCAAKASAGGAADLPTYQSQFIDVIAGYLKDPKYSNLRIVTLLEPDSLANMVTNLDGNEPPRNYNPPAPQCDAIGGPETAAPAPYTGMWHQNPEQGLYAQAIRYDIDTFHLIPNVYIYLDIAHSGWLGWAVNPPAPNPTVANVYTAVITEGNPNRVNYIDGFVSNISNYTPVEEPNLPDEHQSVAGKELRQSYFYGLYHNYFIDEVVYLDEIYKQFVAKGFPTTIGMITDTSRNGWGGSLRPTSAPSAPATIDDLVGYTVGDAGHSVPTTDPTYGNIVPGARIDLRMNRGDWCNQKNAGLGPVPQAKPVTTVHAGKNPHYDAFVWVKTPGESDGTSDPTSSRFDAACTAGDPSLNKAGPLSQAAPEAGQWFDALFDTLVKNAYPPIP